MSLGGAHSGRGTWCECLAGADARTGCGSDLRAWGSATERGCKVRSFVLSNFTLVTFPVAKGSCPAFLPTVPARRAREWGFWPRMWGGASHAACGCGTASCSAHRTCVSVRTFGSSGPAQAVSLPSGGSSPASCSVSVLLERETGREGEAQRGERVRPSLLPWEAGSPSRGPGTLRATECREGHGHRPHSPPAGGPFHPARRGAWANVLLWTPCRWPSFLCCSGSF